MLRLIVSLAVVCTLSAAIGLGKIFVVTTTFSSLCLAVFAFSAVLLIGSFEAYETQAVPIERDER